MFSTLAAAVVAAAADDSTLSRAWKMVEAGNKKMN